MPDQGHYVQALLTSVTIPRTQARIETRGLGHCGRKLTLVGGCERIQRPSRYSPSSRQCKAPEASSRRHSGGQEGYWHAQPQMAEAVKLAYCHIAV